MSVRSCSAELARRLDARQKRRRLLGGHRHHHAVGWLERNRSVAEHQRFDALAVEADPVQFVIEAHRRAALAQYAAADADALAPEIRALARQRTAEIEAAYLEAMRGLQR